ncbi:hypothetical protein [Sphingorhabdus sp. Alg239-R122]|uniref:hypothetical protein n=1 Tax=Sphingorhabdus sp. Alg239-R122 TaxID=2305989 RepID=UPI0013DA3CC2|nr:hypothetical protein [Sphingorhabdus sp. Alg239-R122]
MQTPRYKSLLFCGLAFAALTVPAYSALQGQAEDAPESLLPPGFGDPAPAPAPSPTPEPSPAPSQSPAPSPAPSTGPQVAPANPVTPVPAPSDNNVPDSAPADASSPSPVASVEELPEDTSEEFTSARVIYDLPTRAQRSLDQIGIIGIDQGGFPNDSFATTDGQYLTKLINNIDGPVLSRWGSILLRRALVSQVQTPGGVNGADWAAARAALLLKMGETANARMMLQNVDTRNFNARLYRVAMDTYLANADPSGLCPIVAGGSEASDDVKWDMSRAICSSFSGEQSAATSRIDRLNRQEKASQIDLLLAEKAVGAGVNGRRAVTIKWDDVNELTPWRYGLALATGIQPPIELFNKADVKYRAWQAIAPMSPIEERIASADVAAAMGVLSSRAMVDLYSAAYASGETADNVRAQAALLRNAYANQDMSTRLSSMTSIWGRSSDPSAVYAMLVLTSHAAARFPVSPDYSEEASRLIASMLSAGFDRNAMRWSGTVENGSDGWAMLAIANPEPANAESYDALDDYYDNDYSEESRKSGFLLAALAGLERISGEDRDSFAEKLEINLESTSRWARAITRAADTGEAAHVALLAGAGMQGADWSKMSATHLYHIVSALNKVGLNAEARMIAAEAIARG